MDQTKRTTDSFGKTNEQHEPAASSNEVRTLNELELVLCGGGDAIITWPS